MAIYPEGTKIFVAIVEGDWLRRQQKGSIGVWDYTKQEGDVPPLAIIKGPSTGLIHTRVTVNPKDGEIFVADKIRNTLFTFSLPEVFQVNSAAKNKPNVLP